MFLHFRHHHAVGQGGFHSAVLRLNNTRLHYVYDCGSVDIRILNQRIDEFIGETGASNLAALFVSHFDRDHVSGLDVLLLKLNTTSVVLPYLTQFDRICLLAESLRDGTLDSTYLDLLVDPTAWFGDHGVDRVIYIDDDPSGNARLQETVELSFEIDEDILMSPHIGHPRRVLNRRSGGTVDEVIIPYGAPLTLEVPSVGVLNWQFLTFVHRASSENLDRFRDQVIKLFGSDIFDDGIQLNHTKINAVLKDYPKRIRLANAYREIWRNRNLTSMSVYSGPMQEQQCQTLVWTPSGSSYRTALEKRCACLLTGDTNMQIASRREAFLKHYQPFLEYVITVQVPHHGAAGYFHDDLLNIPARTFVVSAGGENRYGHPHEEVRERLQSRVAVNHHRHHSRLWWVEQESVSAANMPVVTEARDTELKEFVFLRDDFVKVQEELSKRYKPDWHKPFATHAFTEYI